MPDNVRGLRAAFRSWLNSMATPAADPRRIPPSKDEARGGPITIGPPSNTGSAPVDGSEMGLPTAMPEPPQPPPAAGGEDEREEGPSLPAVEVLPTHDGPKDIEEAPAMRDGSRLPVGIIRIILRPVDWLFVFLGPRYGPYLMFFRVAPPGLVAWLGRLRAVRVADHASRRVPAYQTFLGSQGPAAIDLGKLRLPATDKENYVTAYGTAERCVDGRLPTHSTSIDESSGSTGTPHSWTRSLEERRVSHFFISHFARHCYGSEPWITINAFSMGAWATGINIGIALQNCSVVKNVGPDIDKIFSTLQFFGTDSRYLICGYPPFLKHLIDVARERDFPLDQYG